MVEENLGQKIQECRSQVLDTLRELIAIPSINPPGQAYAQCVDFISDKLKEWRVDHKVIRVSCGDYPRYSILGSIGDGQEKLHFHGHYDVVPADSPKLFSPRLQDDRLYGRGASDMKGGVVVMLFALRLLLEYKEKWTGKVTFTLVPDEETGGRLGFRYLFESGLIPPVSLGMLMPEPTSGRIWNANKGALTYRVEIMGKSAHVGLADEGQNAFELMLRVAQSLKELKKDIQKRKTRMTVNPPLAERSVMLIGGTSGSGVSFNLVPERAFFSIDRRINPEENLEEARKELMEVLEEHKKRGIRIKADVLQEGQPSSADPGTRLASTLQKSVAEVTGKIPPFELCPGLCEIRFFNQKGRPAYAYGPGLLEVSHGPKEYVNISDVLNCIEIYLRTTLNLLS